MYKRKCANWIDTFTEWVLPRSEVQERMITWTALYTLACSLRRRVWIPKHINGVGLLGGWECYPFIYMIFVGPPGMRKTATLGYSLELFEGFPGLVAGPTACSQAALSLSLQGSPDTSIYIIAEEFSDLLLKSGPEMYEFLTSAFDGRKNFSTSTIIRGNEFLEKPCINMAAGTTPIWVSSNMPASAIGGGFASRVIFVYSDQLRRRRMYYPDYDYNKGETLKIALLDDLLHIATQLEGPFFLSTETQKYVEDWYQAQKPEIAHPKVQGYLQRKPVHLHKVAMLYRVSYSDELVLEKEDFDAALKILDSIEPDLLQVFEGIGRNPYTFDSKEIVRYVKGKGKVSRKEILAQFQSVTTPMMLNEIIINLISMGVIKALMENGETYYVSVIL